MNPFVFEKELLVLSVLLEGGMELRPNPNPAAVAAVVKANDDAAGAAAWDGANHLRAPQIPYTYHAMLAENSWWLTAMQIQWS